MAHRSFDSQLSVAPRRGLAGSATADVEVKERGGGSPRVGPEVVVTLAYRLYDAAGALVEAPGPDEAIEFVFGLGQASRAIESALEGLEVGAGARVQLSPQHAFGPRDDSAQLVLNRAELPAAALLGDEFAAERDDGVVIFLRVIEIDDVMVRLDANHPLAGQAVTLELDVLASRGATPAELRSAEAELAERSETEAEPHVLATRLLQRGRLAAPKAE
jgi:FKBP-type peptidyl-prolyl cis-trans isomerase SlyD